jgi:hypothetical protein
MVKSKEIFTLEILTEIQDLPLRLVKTLKNIIETLKSERIGIEFSVYRGFS